VDNNGVELSATLQALARRNVAWELTGKLATNNDRIRDLGGLPSLITSATGQNIVGYPIGGVWSRRVATAERNPTTGQATNILCRDTVAGGAPVPCVGATPSAPGAPYHYLGTQTPRVTGALANTITIGQRLRLYALTDFRQGSLVVNTRNLLRCTGVLGAGLCEQNYYPERYTPVQLAYASSAAFGQQFHEPYFEDGSFVKLREVSATYTFPEQWLRSRTSITLSGRELYTWTRFRGIDPEANASNSALTANTLTQAVTPPLSRLVATINIVW
jgi:hypothetical protein